MKRHLPVDPTITTPLYHHPRKTSLSNSNFDENNNGNGDNGVLCIGDLPNEILSTIFTCSSRLSLKDLFLNCSLVCKRWNLIINSDSFLKTLLELEFDDITAKTFAVLPGALPKLRQQLQSSLLFRLVPLKLDGGRNINNSDSDSKFELDLPAIRINSINHFISSLRSLRSLDDWQSLSHCYVNGGLCNHYWYWLINFRQLLNFPEIVSVLCMPFAIGGPDLKVTSNVPLYLLDKDLNLIEEPIDLEKDDQSSEALCWTMKFYPQGVSYVAFEVYEDFCGNEDMPIRLLWPSQMARYEQNMFIAAMNKRYGTGCGESDSDLSSGSAECDDDDYDDGFDSIGCYTKTRDVNEFRRCFYKKSSSESSTSESENAFLGNDS